MNNSVGLNVFALNPHYRGQTLILAIDGVLKANMHIYLLEFCLYKRFIAI